MFSCIRSWIDRHLNRKTENPFPVTSDMIDRFIENKPQTAMIDHRIGNQYPYSDSAERLLQYMIDNKDIAQDVTDYSCFERGQFDQMYHVTLLINDLYFCVWVANFPYAVTNKIAVYKRQDVELWMLPYIGCCHEYDADRRLPLPEVKIDKQVGRTDTIVKWCKMYASWLFEDENDRFAKWLADHKDEMLSKVNEVLQSNTKEKSNVDCTDMETTETASETKRG